MVWFRAHWKALAIGAVLFLAGVGIGAAGADGESAVDPEAAAAEVQETVTVEGEAETVTVEGQGQTVTVMQTETVTETVKPKPKPKPAEPKVFEGNGGKTIRFRTGGGTLRWTNDGDIFQLFDDAFTWSGVNSQAHSGTTFIPAGSYTVIVNAIGNWTIRVPR
jgi:hypothetical protein